MLRWNGYMETISNYTPKISRYLQHYIGKKSMKIVNDIKKQCNNSENHLPDLFAVSFDTKMFK